MRPVQIESVVGPDGVLTLRVPLGAQEAHARVRVTVEPLPVEDTANAADPGGDAEWHRFVDETYGSCADLGLERQPQGEYEQREALG